MTTAAGQWVVTAYALAFGSLLLLGGKLSEVFGRRSTLIVGAAGFAVASAVGGAAQNFTELISAPSSTIRLTSRLSGGATQAAAAVDSDTRAFLAAAIIFVVGAILSGLLLRPRSLLLRRAPCCSGRAPEPAEIEAPRISRLRVGRIPDFANLGDLRLHVAPQVTKIGI